MHSLGVLPRLPQALGCLPRLPEEPQPEEDDCGAQEAATFGGLNSMRLHLSDEQVQTTACILHCGHE